MHQQSLRALCPGTTRQRHRPLLVCGSPAGVGRPCIPSFTYFPRSRPRFRSCRWCHPCTPALWGSWGLAEKAPVQPELRSSSPVLSLTGNCPPLPASGLGPPVEVGVLCPLHTVDPLYSQFRTLSPCICCLPVLPPPNAICLMSLGDNTFSDILHLCLTVLPGRDPL